MTLQSSVFFVFEVREADANRQNRKTHFAVVANAELVLAIGA